MADEKTEYRHRKDTQEPSPSSRSDDEEVGPVQVSEGALLRKIDFRLLPAVGVLYLLSFLDRSNVANARIEGLATDLGMSEWLRVRVGHETSTDARDSGKPVSDGPDAVLRRVCLIRGSWPCEMGGPGPDLG